jgi:hypothetical protein
MWSLLLRNRDIKLLHVKQRIEKWHYQLNKVDMLQRQGWQSSSQGTATQNMQIQETDTKSDVHKLLDNLLAYKLSVVPSCLTYCQDIPFSPWGYSSHWLVLPKSFLDRQTPEPSSLYAVGGMLAMLAMLGRTYKKKE